MNLPNFITLFRFIMIPVFLILITATPARYGLALMVFIIAALSDVVDGYIAKKTNSVTEFGKFIDPMADKLLIAAAFLALTAKGIIPLWLTVIVISKDLIVFLGWIGLSIISGVKKIKPTIMGKITAFMQMLTIVAAITGAAFINIIFYITAISTISAGMGYIMNAIRNSDKNGN